MYKDHFFQMEIIKNVKWAVKMFMTAFQLECHLETTDYCPQKRSRKAIQSLGKQSRMVSILKQRKYFFHQVIACKTVRQFEIQKYHTNVTTNREKSGDCTPTNLPAWIKFNDYG